MDDDNQSVEENMFSPSKLKSMRRMPTMNESSLRLGKLLELQFKMTSVIGLGQFGGSINNMDIVDESDGSAFSARRSLRTSVRALKKKDSQSTATIAKRISREDIRLVYKIGKLLGCGNFGTVRLATKTGFPHMQFAVKSIPRKKVENDMDTLE